MIGEYLLPALGLGGALLLYVLITRGPRAALMTILALAVAGVLTFVVYLGLAE